MYDGVATAHERVILTRAGLMESPSGEPMRCSVWSFSDRLSDEWPKLTNEWRDRWTIALISTAGFGHFRGPEISN